jgi:hypothetical protein
MKTVRIIHFDLWVKNNFNRVKTDFALEGQLFEHDVVDEKKK